MELMVLIFNRNCWL